MHTTPTPLRAALTRGIAIGLLITILAVLLSGLYLWNALLPEKGPEPSPFVVPSNKEPETPRADADIQILHTVSNSDEIASIEADLESTNLDSLDKELDLIENDLDQ